MKNNKISQSPVELVVGNPIYESQVELVFGFPNLSECFSLEEDTSIQGYDPQDYPIQEDIFHFEEPDEYEEYMQEYNIYYTPTPRE